MFGKQTIEEFDYLLLSVYKYGTSYCASYNKNSDGTEFITSINTGEIFYNLTDFITSIHGISSGYEWIECLFYDEDSKLWAPLYFLLSDDS
jgi:hypothetical protein